MTKNSSAPASGLGDGDLREQLSEGLMTVTEVAAFLSVSRSFLYGEMARGTLPWAKLGRGRRVPRLAVLEYAASRIHGAPSDPGAR